MRNVHADREDPVNKGKITVWKETLDEERKKRYQAESQLEYRMTKGMKENEKMFIANEVMTPDDLQSVDISLYHVSLVL